MTSFFTYSVMGHLGHLLDFCCKSIYAILTRFNTASTFIRNNVATNLLACYNAKKHTLYRVNRGQIDARVMEGALAICQRR